MRKRFTEKFLIENVNTERYRKSALQEMKRLLNEYDLKVRALSNFSTVTREKCLSTISL